MIIGITGTIGAGKGEAVQYLVEEKGFKHFSVRQFLEEEIARRGLIPTRDAMREVANDIRATKRPSYIIEMLYQKAALTGTPSVIESVRAIAEAEFLKNHNASILAIDAEQKLRYERIVSRGSSTDHIDFNTFVMQEELEMKNTDPDKQNITAVMSMADYRIDNADSLPTLREKIDDMLEHIPSQLHGAHPRKD